MSDKQRVLLYDLETAPLLAYIWQPKVDYVPMDLLIHDSFLLTWSAKWYGEKQIRTGILTPGEAVDQDDKRIVTDLAEMIRQADIVIAHNGDRFDIPMFNNRLLQNKLEPLGPIRSIDTLTLARKNFRLAYNKLDYLGEYLGLGRKIKTDFDLWKKCYHGDARALAKMSKYNVQDVKLLEQVFDALKPYVKGLARLIDADFDMEMACPSCGSEDLMRRGLYRTNASTFPKYQCQDCGRYSKGRVAEKSLKLALTPL